MKVKEVGQGPGPVSRAGWPGGWASPLPLPPGLHRSGSYGDLTRRCPRSRLTRGGHLQPLPGRIWNFSDGSCLLLSLNQTPVCGLLLPQLPPPPARPLQPALREKSALASAFLPPQPERCSGVPLRAPPRRGAEHLPAHVLKRAEAGLVLLPQHLRAAESPAGPGRWRGDWTGFITAPTGARRRAAHRLERGTHAGTCDTPGAPNPLLVST